MPGELFYLGWNHAEAFTSQHSNHTKTGYFGCFRGVSEPTVGSTGLNLSVSACCIPAEYFVCS